MGSKVIKMTQLKKRMRDYRDNQSGQFGILFGLAIVPIMIAVAYVGDMTYAGKVKAELKASLDSAALAAVINQNISEGQRADFALAHFNENFEFSDMFTLNVVDASAARVELAATGGFPSYIGAMTGRDKFELNSHATSVLTKEDVVCVLALDETSAGAFTMSDGAELYGDKCSVQVNSVHMDAAIVETHSRATAKSFCIAGGARGSYSPFVNTDCGRVEDPYKDIPAPPLRECLLENLAGNSGGSGGGEGGGSGVGQLSAAQRLALGSGGGGGGGLPDIINILDNAVLLPGTYCSPVVISGKNVTLQPGTYVFQNSLIIKNQSSVSGDGVTLSFNGERSHIEIMSGSQVYLKAPSREQYDQNGSNIYAGLAIFQHAHGAGGMSNSDTATEESFLAGGSGMSIVGTVYLPSQRLYIGRDSSTHVVNQTIPQSPATSFVAHQVHLAGAKIRVAVNHEAASLPAILPRSDEGARLIE